MGGVEGQLEFHCDIISSGVDKQIKPIRKQFSEKLTSYKEFIAFLLLRFFNVERTEFYVPFYETMTCFVAFIIRLCTASKHGQYTSFVSKQNESQPYIVLTALLGFILCLFDCLAYVSIRLFGPYMPAVFFSSFHSLHWLQHKAHDSIHGFVPYTNPGLFEQLWQQRLKEQQNGRFFFCTSSKDQSHFNVWYHRYNTKLCALLLNLVRETLSLTTNARKFSALECSMYKNTNIHIYKKSLLTMLLVSPFCSKLCRWYSDIWHFYKLI